MPADSARGRRRHVVGRLPVGRVTGRHRLHEGVGQRRHEPAQTVLQWSTFSTTSGATVTMSASGLRVHSVGGPTNLVIDVAGYYSPAIYVDILPSSTTAFGEVYSSTDMISGSGSSKLSPGDMTITIRRNIQYCDIQATAESAGYRATAVLYSADTILVQVRDNAGNPARAYASVSVNC